MLPSLSFLHCDAYPHCTASVAKRFGYHTIQFKTNGIVDLSYDEYRIQLSGAYLWPAMPGPEIRFSRAAGCGEWNHRYVAFTGPGVQDLADPGDLLTRPLAVPRNRAGAIAQIMDDLIDTAKQTGEVQRLKATVILQRLLIEAAEIRGAPQGERDPWLEEVLEALKPSRTRPEYDEVARRMGVSLPTLRRQFRERMGVPIHEYHLRMRLDTARRLLARTNRPLKDIASELGYADVFYFTRQFTHRVGASPGVYRASAQGRLSGPTGG